MAMAHMASLVLFLASICLLNITNLPFLAKALSSCNEACNTADDCDGQLTCINGKCDDDPDVGTHICSGGGGTVTPPPEGDNCQPFGNLPCNGCRECNGQSYPQYTCSPPVSSSTQAILTKNGFGEGEDGGDPSECDEKYHDNSERVVALSTGWFNNKSRCNQMIRITARNGKSVTAKVVDECDSVNGCDKAHAFQKPCRNNIVDGSQAVWDALGLDTGEEQVTWSMA